MMIIDVMNGVVAPQPHLASPTTSMTSPIFHSLNSGLFDEDILIKLLWNIPKCREQLLHAISEGSGPECYLGTLALMPSDAAG
jgi:hypothetical protein